MESVHCDKEQLLSSDYEKVKEFLSCPLNKLHQYSELHAEFKQMFQHLDRHLNEIVFLKCDDRSCCSPWKSEELRKFLEKFFAPSLGNYIEGH